MHVNDDGGSEGPTPRSAALVAEITRRRIFAERVDAAARRLPAVPEDLREDVLDRAAAIARLARQPITVGVVGQFSAGKSLLLGLLLGKPDLLPVADDPLTANVTALHLQPVPAGAAPEVVAAQVHYLDAAELTACVDHMLSVLTARARHAGLDPAEIEALRATEDLDARWDPLERWCREVAWPRQEPRLNLLVRELMAMKAQSGAGRDLLGWAPTADPDTVREALALPGPDAWSDPRRFPATPPAGLAAGHRGPQPTREQLRDTLTLVKRVDLTVRVPEDVWDLAQLRDENEVVLLDFPGLGAKSSGGRDYYLSRRELAEVTTIFVLLDARFAGSDIPTEFPLMMARPVEEIHDSVLVGIGRFDQLPGQPEAVLARRESGGPAITDSELEEGLLAAVLNDARGLVGLHADDRITMHSGMVGTGALAGLGRTTHQASWAAERGLDEQVPRAQEKARAWDAIAEYLAADDPRTTLSHPLREFARDGGVHHVRQVLERHVTRHGLTNRLRLVDRHAGELDAARERLCAVLDDSSEATARALLAARQPVTLLMTDASSALAEMATRAKAELTDPRRLTLPTGRTLAVTVEEQVVDDVFSWPEWRRLFHAVKDRLVKLPSSNSTGLQVPGIPKTSSSDLPGSTAVFAERFELTVEHAEKAARDRARDALRAWAADRTRELANLRARRDELITDEARRRAESVTDGHWSIALDRALDLSWLPEALAEPLDRDLADLRNSGGAARAASPLAADRWFAWNPEVPDDVRRAMDVMLARHQTQPARLRRELVTGAVDSVLALVGTRQSGLADGVVELLTLVREALTGYDAWVAAVTGEVEAPDHDPAAELRAIPHPSSGEG